MLGVRLLRTVSHKNFAIKDRMGLSVQHSFVKLMARAMRPAMIDYRMRIAMLGRADHVQPINQAFAALVIERDGDIVTRKRCAQVNCSRVVT